MLGQEAVSGKSNEITAIPLLLERLALKGALVTPDAIGAPGSVAETILARGGDHRLALKANRPAAAKDGEAFFTDPSSDSVETGETTDGDHGRIETRREGKLTRERRPHRSSARLDAATFAQAVRGPWGIGNRLHGMLDVVFKDGLSRRRIGHGPENMAVVRPMATNLLHRAKPTTSLKNRRKRAGWNTSYLESLIRQVA